MNASLTEIRDRWVWPKADGIAFDHIRLYAPLLRTVARYPKQRGVCVQAGGNAGMYPAILAEYYDRVITFEPEDLNFHCLTENCKRFSNVEAHQAILGDSDCTVGLTLPEGWNGSEVCVNTGAFHVDGEGSIPQVRIDDLNLDRLDFLQLDVEGYELNALRGAAKTIDKFSPVIMLECFNQGADPHPFVEELGYHRVIKGVYDQVFMRG